MNGAAFQEKAFAPVSLEAMLWAREKRAWKQMQLNKKFRQPLIAFTMNIPGEYKASPGIYHSFDWGLGALIEGLEQCGIPKRYEETHYLATGPEAYLVTEGDSRRIKRLTITLEDGHPLGRLFDMDVITPDRHGLTRKELGFAERKCLLCNEDARVCARSRRHSPAELQNKLDEMMHRAGFPHGDTGGIRIIYTC